MSVPGIVQSTLNGDEIAARVSLGGEDELFITSSSTLVYRSDGILSDESVEEYPHEADRLTLSEGRRKTKFTLEYPLEGTKEFTVPSDKTDAVLHPVLAGVLNGNGITDPGETVVKTYRFSELTLIITSDRLVKHIGGAVWDGDYEGYHFDDVTKLAFEDGSVATQIVLTVAGRPERIKAPNEEANDLRERLKRALFEYHGVTSLAELNETVGGDEDGDDRGDGAVDFGDGVDPLDANPPEPDDRETVAATETAADSEESQSQSADPLAAAGDPQQSQRTQQQSAQQQSTQRQSAQQSTRAAATQGESSSDSSTNYAGTATDDVETAFDGASDAPVGDEPESESTWDDSGLVADAAAESASAASATAAETDAADYDPAELAERIDSLEAAVEKQSELIERQQETIEQLIAELRQGR
ncbi:hypothetical protein Htur_2131 [Haloterrigena turkmenica DSM 5511]|uniref:DUF7115 domain-containing protein n=1 Tax=Haloterrigena turkmenica (strain ATCC 51198 / DSM 5511 / JCM 9101 / NCIMB 13204 / VKM B-1734 / 4k) TaxID=543526 RepID=D2RTR3_HALTV|nr:hypothetical protein [Haloterrigena turkmenica]ADB61014.1 hypothetical protein Htur_2131 [Haloterrigena turkmenica DSM 5511]